MSRDAGETRLLEHREQFLRCPFAIEAPGVLTQLDKALPVGRCRDHEYPLIFNKVTPLGGALAEFGVGQVHDHRDGKDGVVGGAAVGGVIGYWLLVVGRGEWGTVMGC